MGFPIKGSIGLEVGAGFKLAIYRKSLFQPYSVVIFILYYFERSTARNRNKRKALNMNLRERISLDLKNALRGRRIIDLSVLRMLQSAIRNREIEKKKGDAGLTDEEVIEVVTSEIKKRKEAIEGYMKGQRQDLVDKEKAELEVLMNYMPSQMGEAEIRKEAKKAIEEAGAKIPQDMGRVMKILMPRMKGKADGALVNRIVKEELEKMLNS